MNADTFRFTDAELMNLDYSLSKIIHTGLVQFHQSHIDNHHGVPAQFLSEDEGHTVEEYVNGWQEGRENFLAALEKMIYTFDPDEEPDINDYEFGFDFTNTSEEHTGVVLKEGGDEEKRRYDRDVQEWQRKRKEGFALLMKHFDSLWI